MHNTPTSSSFETFFLILPGLSRYSLCRSRTWLNCHQWERLSGVADRSHEDQSCDFRDLVPEAHAGGGAGMSGTPLFWID